MTDFSVINNLSIPPNDGVDTWSFNHVVAETLDVYVYSGAYTFIDTGIVNNLSVTNCFTGVNQAYISNMNVNTGAINSLTVNQMYSPTLAIINNTNGLSYNTITGQIGCNLNSLVPTATVIASAISPPGYLLCDGSDVSRTTYAYLFSLIGTTFGSGDGSTTFNVPTCTGLIPNINYYIKYN